VYFKGKNIPGLYTVILMKKLLYIDMGISVWDREHRRRSPLSNACQGAAKATCTLKPGAEGDHRLTSDLRDQAQPHRQELGKQGKAADSSHGLVAIRQDQGNNRSKVNPGNPSDNSGPGLGAGISTPELKSWLNAEARAPIRLQWQRWRVWLEVPHLKNSDLY